MRDYRTAIGEHQKFFTMHMSIQIANVGQSGMQRRTLSGHAPTGLFAVLPKSLSLEEGFWQHESKFAVSCVWGGEGYDYVEPNTRRTACVLCFRSVRIESNARPAAAGTMPAKAAGFASCKLCPVVTLTFGATTCFQKQVSPPRVTKLLAQIVGSGVFRNEIAKLGQNVKVCWLGLVACFFPTALGQG